MLHRLQFHVQKRRGIYLCWLLPMLGFLLGLLVSPPSAECWSWSENNRLVCLGFVEGGTTLLCTQGKADHSDPNPTFLIGLELQTGTVRWRKELPDAIRKLPYVQVNQGALSSDHSTILFIDENQRAVLRYDWRSEKVIDTFISQVKKPREFMNHQILEVVQQDNILVILCYLQRSQMDTEAFVTAWNISSGKMIHHSSVGDLASILQVSPHGHFATMAVRRGTTYGRLLVPLDGKTEAQFENKHFGEVNWMHDESAYFQRIYLDGKAWVEHHQWDGTRFMLAGQKRITGSGSRNPLLNCLVLHEIVQLPKSFSILGKSVTDWLSQRWLHEMLHFYHPSSGIERHVANQTAFAASVFPHPDFSMYFVLQGNFLAGWSFAQWWQIGAWKGLGLGTVLLIVFQFATLVGRRRSQGSDKNLKPG